MLCFLRIIFGNWFLDFLCLICVPFFTSFLFNIVITFIYVVYISACIYKHSVFTHVSKNILPQSFLVN